MTPTRLLFALTLALPACYPHRGDRPPADPEATLRLALDACARQDLPGARHLFARLARRHPDHPDASRADLPDPCAPPENTP